MSEQYFVKRGENVKGPFSAKKIRSLFEAAKLKANDRISQSCKGPWESVAAVRIFILGDEQITSCGTEDQVSSPVAENSDDYDGTGVYDEDDGGYEAADGNSPALKGSVPPPLTASGGSPFKDSVCTRRMDDATRT